MGHLNSFHRGVIIVSSLVTVSLLVKLPNAVAGPWPRDISPGQAASITITAGNANAPANLYDNPSNSGRDVNAVNLYTGQHNETFNLLSIPGRAGLGISLSLEYDGNVAQAVRQPNRFLQPSPFGLGFSLGLRTIVCDHRNTVDYADDFYTLQTGSSATRLRFVTDSLFIPEDGNPWKFYRHVKPVGGVAMVVGWTVLMTDGHKYVFGDCDTVTAEWNATRNILYYGQFVGAGITPDDKVYPHQWDLAYITDLDGLNTIEFKYVRDTIRLAVRSLGGLDTTHSAHPYIRASYLQSICSPGGYRLEFAYSSRADTQAFYAPYECEFYRNKRVDRIVTIAPGGDTLSQIRFSYDYLNSHRADAFKKLLLKSIRHYSGDGSTALPELKFEYVSEDAAPGFGAVRRITNPAGGVRELQYGLVDSAGNFSHLRQKIVEDDFNMTYSGQTITTVEDDFICVMQDPAVESTVVLSVWDGYWHTRSFPFRGDHRDQVGVSGDGWAAIPLNADTITVVRWMGGYWDIDTLAGAITRPSVMDHVYVWAGRNSFVAVSGPGVTAEGWRGAQVVRYFHWNGEEWRGFDILDYEGTPDHWNHNVSFREDFFVFCMWAAEDQAFGQQSVVDAVVVGKYLPLADTLITFKWSGFGLYEYPTWYGIPFAASSDLAVWQGRSKDSCHTVRWTSGGWFRDSKLIWPLQINDHTATDNGFIESLSPGGPVPLADGLTSYFFAQDSLASLGENYYPTDNMHWPTWAASRHMVAQNVATDVASLFRWDGYHWTRIGSIQAGIEADNIAVCLWDDAYALGPTQYGNGFRIRRYNGLGQWSDSIRYIPQSAIGWAAGNSIALYATTFLNYAWVHPFLWSPYYWDDVYHQLEIDMLADCGSVISAMVRTGSGSKRHTTFAVNVKTDHSTAATDSFLVDVHAFRVVDTLLQGKPPLAVVKQVKLLERLDDPDPRIIAYNYFGGMLAQDGATPRFCQAQVSDPYYATGAPLSYRVSLFYNDVDSATFYDLSIADSIEIPADLADSGLYGFRGGGYHLSGQPYLTYRYDTLGNHTDTTRYYYSVYELHPDIKEIYRRRLDSVYNSYDGITNWTHYRYDALSGNCIEFRQPHKAPGSYVVELNHLAYLSDSALDADNMLSLVDTSTSFYCLADDTTWFSRSVVAYERHGSWEEARVTSWQDPTIPGDTITSFLATAWDDFGRLTDWEDAAGLPHSVKFAPDSLHSLATISNASGDECLFFDAEFPPVGDTMSFDGWVIAGGGPWEA